MKLCNSITVEHCTCSEQVGVDKVEKEGGGENKGVCWGGGREGAAVLTTARLIHPEHAELLCSVTGFKSSLATEYLHDFD